MGIIGVKGLIKARTGSAWEASFQRVISVPLISCLFQQTALSNHGQFKPDLCSFLYNGTLTSRKFAFGWRQAWLGGVRVAFVNVVAHSSIDIFSQNFVTFCYAWTDLHDLYIGE